MVEREPTAVRRIAVALDATPHCLPGLALATQIAAALSAEIEGVFIEDTELLRMAGLPFLRELRATTLGESTLDKARLQRELRAAARGARAQVERSAGEFGIAWSFRVWRGDLEADILDAARDAEFFALGRIGRFAPLRRRPKAAPRGIPSGSLTIGALFDGTAAATRALATAQALAEHRDAARLVVILQSGSVADAATLGAAARRQLAGLHERVALVDLGALAATAAGRTAATAGIGLLVVAAANPLLTSPSPWTGLEAFDCPILIAR